MTNREILTAEPVAYISALGGIEIKHIEYGIEDRIFCVSNAWNGKRTAHKVRVYYSNEPYIILHGLRYKLSEAILCNFGG